jgi:hypothetical protein
MCWHAEVHLHDKSAAIAAVAVRHEELLRAHAIYELMQARKALHVD